MTPSEPREFKPGSPPDNGLGALCREAQADGVPCCEPGRSCPKCEKAWFRTEEGAESEVVLHEDPTGETTG